MKDDIDLFDYNVQERVNAFVAAAVSQVNRKSSSPGMWLFYLLSHYLVDLVIHFHICFQMNFNFDVCICCVLHGEDFSFLFKFSHLNYMVARTIHSICTSKFLLMASSYCESWLGNRHDIICNLAVCQSIPPLHNCCTIINFLEEQNLW